MKFPLFTRRPIIRDCLIFTGFLALTVIMTWPWALQLRDGVSDPGDPYAISYFLWWDFHQTFHNPTNLFQATVFYPYHNSLAFGEYDYGVSLIFFPLFVLGLRPLTVYSIAAFLSFPFTGYGTFRLARTLSGSSAIAWVAGIIIAFLPFRFHHLSHLHLIFAGWIPLLFEALVLFARQASWPRAAWLGFAFLMNALTCATWLLLTIIPLAISAALLLTRNHAYRDRRLWLRAATTVILALLLLLPFLLPFRRASTEYGFTRSPDEVGHYSARIINWLAVEERNQVWRSFGSSGKDTEMVLFPGLLAPLLALGAFLISPRKPAERVNEAEPQRHRRVLLALLDSTAILSGIVALLATRHDFFRVRLFGHVLLSVSGPTRAFNVFIVTLFVRCLITYPVVIRQAMSGDRNLLASFTSRRRSELFGHAVVWIAIGFAGSFGLNFLFHKFLYDYVPIFRAMRVASRWAMICYVGLALLAGLGAERFASAVGQYWSRAGKAVAYSLIIIAVLFELHAAPLKMIRGEVDPDALTMDLKYRQMAGGILEFPIGERADHLYMLRAADHLHPLVNGKDSFVPPLQNEIEQLTTIPVIPDRLLDIFESIPVSYITVHYAFLLPEERESFKSFLNRGIAMGRLRFIKSFDFKANDGIDQHTDLYVVTRTEPNATN